jgi:SAM-dependent methyltransferase
MKDEVDRGTTPGGSLAFDRAAEYYDETRQVGEAAMTQTVVLLEAELSGRGRVLEIGVGTGLLALPWAARGVRLTGVDLSLPMMRKLVEKSGSRAPLPLVRGDATRLPFRDDAFGGAYARWVLHLVPAWRDVVGELCRVARPGSRILIEAGGNIGPWEAMHRRFQEITGGDMGPVGLDVRAGFGELDATFAEHGATFRALPERIVAVDDPVSVQGFLDRVERRVYSWTWRVSDEDIQRAIAEIRPWAEEHWGRLDVPLDTEHPMLWRAYDLA